MNLNDFRESYVFNLIDGKNENKKMHFFEKNNQIQINKITMTDMIDYGT